MVTQKIEFVRLIGDERRVGAGFAEVSRHWQGDKERFVLVSPHDDDAALGAGLLIQLAKRENVPVHVLIVTDGSMGYCCNEERPTICETRKRETFNCYKKLGLAGERIQWLGFPDCQLHNYRGRSEGRTKSGPQIAGFTGLQNSFTYHLRQIRPTQCFLPTWNDLHPDHRIVYEEFLISLFHSAGNIWPELGKPLDSVPHVHETAVYCDFAGPPTLRICTGRDYLEKKIKAVQAFRSQKQISSLVENVRHSGPQEYVRTIEFRLYHPARYYNMFEKKESIPAIY